MTIFSIMYMYMFIEILNLSNAKQEVDNFANIFVICSYLFVVKKPLLSPYPQTIKPAKYSEMVQSISFCHFGTKKEVPENTETNQF